MAIFGLLLVEHLDSGKVCLIGVTVTGEDPKVGFLKNSNRQQQNNEGEGSPWEELYCKKSRDTVLLKSPCPVGQILKNKQYIST